MALGTLGKYERLDVLGHGVSGIVYLAKDTLLNKQVALKEVDVMAGDIRRFLEEARVLDRLRHPNIVRVNSVDRIDGKVIIDMEYVRGRNLQEMLRAEGPLASERALDIAAQILDALDYAHRMQTVHRDIKPANILINREGQVKLVDFGLAEILATNAYAGGAGTYAYMAPEDFAEDDRSDNQSDIWAVGVTLFEMLTGGRPFQVMKVKDPFAWKRVLENEPPVPLSDFLPDVPLELQAILDRALAKDKRERYTTAGQFRDDLLHFREGQELSLRTLRFVELRAGNSTRLMERSVTKTDVFDMPPPVTRTGPGVVVADVSKGVPLPPSSEARDETVQERKGRGPFARKKVAAHMVAEPTSIDFGAVRKGELRSTRIKVRVEGVSGNVVGSVGHKPDWLTVQPLAFDRARQTLTLTAHSGRTWETGEFEDTLAIMTEAGSVEIPLRLMVLKSRPTFLQIAKWYVPLFALSLFPALTVALGGGSHALATGAGWLVPPAALASGMLALMLLLVCIAADVGMGERVACGFLMAVMCLVLGAAAGQGRALAFSHGMRYIALTGGVLGCVVLLQMLHLRIWKLWAFLLVCLSLFIGSTFLQVLHG